MRQPQLSPELSAIALLLHSWFVTGETPAQSPEHEQCGHAVKGAEPVKRQKGSVQRARTPRRDKASDIRLLQQARARYVSRLAHLKHKINNK
ncbi:hypothetical protein VZT92_001311 [Zoarces viviparus]|uniref:Secreted protein n=1 Tax=Zoarces viviparus TaxID=48416 RepID=A0AAW1G3I1_ZOAVI